jgi:hypothetical protein
MGAPINACKFSLDNLKRLGHLRGLVADGRIILQEVLGRTNRLVYFHYILSILYDTDRIENTASNSYSIINIYSLRQERVYRDVA